MSKSNYAKWIRKDLWTLIEAAYLLCDKEPLRDLDEFLRCVKSGQPNDVIDIYDDLKNAGLKKSLKLISPGPGTYPGHQRVVPASCVRWALERDIDVPKPLRYLAENGPVAIRRPVAELAPKERNFLLRLIRVLDDMADLPKEHHRAGQIVESHAQQLGINVGAAAVAQKLKAARAMDG